METLVALVMGVIFIASIFIVIIVAQWIQERRKIRQEEHYGAIVWVNPVIERLRRKHCLCLRCNKLGKCADAKLLYEICKYGNRALAMARCIDWEEKEEE